MAASDHKHLDQLDTPANNGLAYAVALQKKAAAVGFDWPEISGVIAKIQEELQEVSEEITGNADKLRLQDELGDLLFACCNLARHLSVNPEQAIQRCNNKFYRRFSHVEQRVIDQGKTLQQCSLAELDGYWDEAKRLEKTNTNQDNSRLKPTRR